MTGDKVYNGKKCFGKPYKKKFKTLIIGRRAVGAIIAAVSTAVFCAGFASALKNVNFIKQDEFLKKCVNISVPYISSRGFDGEKEMLKYFESPVMYVSKIPYLYDIKQEKNNTQDTKNTQVFNADNADVSKQSTSEKTEYNYGKVSEQSNASVDLDIKNETGYEINKKELMKSCGKISLSSSDKPQVLIVHTHASESYTQSEKYHYSQSDFARCQDIRYNVVRVGDELESELKKRGLNVIHDKTINDYPSYNNSYNKTKELIEKYIKEYPTIKCVFDVHRDAIVREDETKVKLTKEINGEKAAQVMIVCGSDASGLYNPDWRENLGFALKIQNSIETKYPGLMRPVNLRRERFNMHETTGSLLLEFGTHGNTLDEAIASAKYIAEGIYDALTVKN